MHLTTLDEASIQAIGHAFGYYDYGKETGMGGGMFFPRQNSPVYLRFCPRDARCRTALHHQ